MIKTGSKILKEVSNEFELNNSEISFGNLLGRRLKGMVVVPEEKFAELEALAAQGILRNSLIKDFHKEQWEHHQLKEKLERIKMLIENFPKHPDHSADVTIWVLEVDEWLEELRKVAMDECPFLDKCINQNTDKCIDCLGDTGRKNYIRKDDEIKEMEK